MNSQRAGLRVASVIFAIFAIGHIVRLFRQLTVTVGSVIVPMGASWVALIVALFLCIWMWRLASTAR